MRMICRKEKYASMFDLINIVVAIGRLVIDFLRLILDILKEQKQESNRRPLPRE